METIEKEDKSKGKEEMTDVTQPSEGKKKIPRIFLKFAIVLEARLLLLKSLLRTMIPLLSGRLNILEGPLPKAMKTIFSLPNLFGGKTMASVTNIMATIIQNEPTSFTALSNTGVPDAFLDSLKKEIIPSSSVSIIQEISMKIPYFSSLVHCSHTKRYKCNMLKQ